MSDVTANLSLPLLQAAQAQKHVTHNEALLLLDGVSQLSIKSRSIGSPPTNPTDGDRYIVAESPTSEWQNHAGSLAISTAGSWRFVTPKSGWFAWIEDEAAFLSHDGTNWIEPVIAGSESAQMMGINAEADNYNRLLVKTNAALFSHDDVTPGSGDLRVNYNKLDASAFTSFTFQSNYSGRAEVGLLGNDDLTVQTSPDGVNWTQALQISQVDGEVVVPKIKVQSGSIDGVQIGEASQAPAAFSDLSVTGDVTVGASLSAACFKSLQLTATSNSVVSVSPPQTGGIMVITGLDSVYPRGEVSGIFVYDVGASPTLLTLAVSTRTDNLGLTPLTGSTGAADRLSLAINSGQIAFENRYAFSFSLSLIFLGGE